MFHVARRGERLFDYFYPEEPSEIREKSLAPPAVERREARLRLRHRLDDVGVARVRDGHARDAVVATAGRAQVDVV
eukprot:29029-Pelagococcus_subviridis.AAC.2